MIPISRGYVLTGFATVLVLATVGTALFLYPPSLYRALRLDQERIHRLTLLQERIHNTYRQTGMLPAQLQDICAQCGDDARDPETQVPFGYEKTGNQSYRLCAHFAHESQRHGRRTYGFHVIWEHPAGDYCFDLKPPAKN